MENPELMVGIPLVLLGALGLFVAVSLFAMPEPAGGGRLIRRAEEHPTPSQYVVVGMFLAFVTAVEVALYYIDMNFNVMVTVLIVLSAIKFLFVVGFFMHLRFDSRVFSVLFFGGLLLALALFTVAITTLDANIV
jgi:cytochrome c oxidase subunit 4